MLKFSITSELSRRILVLDGGLGTMIQDYGLTEEDYRGEPFRDWPMQLEGCSETLALTRPDVIREIHEAYLQAGADIISTDTFNANALSLADRMLDFYAYDICRAAASLARAAADKFTLSNPSKPRFVAGSIGPGNRSASISPDVNNPAARAVTFDQLRQVYYDQARGLLDGGADVMLIETAFDTLNVKAALFAIDTLADERSRKIPVMVSGTLTDVSGRTLSGQTVEAFYASVHRESVLSVGLNCGLGAEKMLPYIGRLAQVACCAVSAHPNAGMPDGSGGYGETPRMMAETIERYLKQGLLNIVGGCCGTTPVHIAEIAAVAAQFAPRRISAEKSGLFLSGLEPFDSLSHAKPVLAGSQADATVSETFATMIREKRYEAAINLMREEAEAGTSLLPVCVDETMGNGQAAIREVLNLAMAVPEAARVPVMIRSSEWKVLEAGMQCVQGKPLVGKLSLRDGDDELVRRLDLIARYGAAALIALTDEQGEAVGYERKTAVVRRIFELLPQTGVPLRDIVIDAGVRPAATGTEEGMKAAANFLQTCRWIKENHPEVSLYGETDRISGAFPKGSEVSKALNSLFLVRATEAGLDIAVANRLQSSESTEIPAALSTLCEAAIDNCTEATVTALAGYGLSDETKEKVGVLTATTDNPEETFGKLGELEILYRTGAIPLPLLLRGIEVAAHHLTGQCSGNGTIVMATVTDDRYDEEYAPVKMLLEAAGYTVDDLGILNDPQQLAERLKSDTPTAVLLRVLTSEAAVKAVGLLALLQKQGWQTPVVIGGTASSELHTAVVLAPQYGAGTLIHAAGIVPTLNAVRKICSPDKEMYLIDLQMAQMALREAYADRTKSKPYRTLDEARANGLKPDFSTVHPPRKTGRVVFDGYDLARLVPLINRSYLFGQAGMPGRYPEILNDPDKGEQARELDDIINSLLDEIIGKRLLRADGVVALYPARSEGDRIVLFADTDYTQEVASLPQLRNQQRSQAVNLSLADFVAPQESGVPDAVGLYAVTAGIGVEKLIARYRENGDERRTKLAGMLAERLCEAFAEELHRYARVELWGIESSQQFTPKELLAGKYPGIRPAVGMPSCPDRSQRETIFRLLDAEAQTGMVLDDNYAITPAASACGIIFSLPEARNFTVGQIDRQQLETYAQQRGVTVEQLRKLIPQYIQE